jgi:hypothetical protein
MEVGMVEQLAPDHHRVDLRVHRLNEVGGRLRGAGRMLLPFGELPLRS